MVLTALDDFECFKIVLVKKAFDWQNVKLTVKIYFLEAKKKSERKAPSIWTLSKRVNLLKSHILIKHFHRPVLLGHLRATI